MPQAPAPARHLATARTIDIRELAHLNHGYVPFCLRCIEEQTQAGTNPKHARELSHKGRSWQGR